MNMGIASAAGKAILTGIAEEVGKTIWNKLYQSSFIGKKKINASWYSIATQLKEGEIIRLSEIGDKMQEIIEEYNPVYEISKGIPLIKYNENKFHLLIDFYWADTETDREDLIDFLKDDSISEIDDPIIESFNIYVIPYQPKEIEIIRLMKNLVEELKEKIINSFNVYVPWDFLYIFMENQKAIQKIKSKFEKEKIKVDEGHMNKERYLRIIKPSLEEIEKIIKILK